MKGIRREIEDLERFEEIVKILSREGFGFLLQQINVLSKTRFSSRKTPAPEVLRETIEELGPTFIKFGQIMAERPDIVPRRYTEELQKLQDNAPSFDNQTAMDIVEEEIGLENFAYVKEHPIAAASIAQVHKAQLENGKDVVVKIRRPGIHQRVEEDLDILLYIARKAEKHSDKLESIRFSQLAREFAEWTKNELNLKKEAQNAQIFKENMKDKKNVYVPEVYPELTTEKVLVMEYIDGVKCTESQKLKEMDIDTYDLAETAISAGMKQIIADGFFHADPHPSNFLIREEGELVYLDFGMMGQITRDLQDKMALMLIHTLNEDSSKVLETMREIGYEEENLNEERITEIVNKKILRLRNSTIEETSISKELLDLIVKAGQNGLHMPTSMTLMGKNLLTMEGIGLTICPDFSPTEKYEEEGRRLLKQNNKPEEMMQQTMLDLLENKELFTKPATQLKKKINSNGKTNIPDVKNNFDLDLLPAALVLSSAALTIGATTSPVFQKELFYVGIGQLIAGLYFYHR